MKKLKIVKHNGILGGENFYFLDEKEFLVFNSGYRCGYEVEKYNKSCDFCGENFTSATVIISDRYIDIIKQLKKAGLLSEDYPLLCCRCFNKIRRKESWGK